MTTPFARRWKMGANYRSASPPILRIAIVCFAFAALFGVLFIGTIQTARRTLGSAVAIGWTGSTCAAFCAIAVGMLMEKKWLVVSGALAILVALAMMFSLIDNVDLAPTIASLFGQPLPSADGRVLFEMFLKAE